MVVVVASIIKLAQVFEDGRRQTLPTLDSLFMCERQVLLRCARPCRYRVLVVLAGAGCVA